MANEFVARNGVIALNNSTVSGSLNVTNGITGSLLGTSSYANNADLLDGLDSTVFALTSSVNAYTASINAFSASILSYTSSASTRLSALEAATASLYIATASFGGRVGALEAYTSSLNNKTSSFATTGSNTFIGTQTITGSINQSGSFTSTGTITAQTLVVQTVSSSVIYSSGSNIFGNSLANTQVFTGSFSQTGSTAYFAGNVGIGTTSPIHKLNIFGTAGSGTVTPQETLVHIGGNELGGNGGYAGIRLGGAGDATNYGVYIRGVKQGSYGSYWDTALTFNVTRTSTTSTIDEAMRITSDSRVGIGTTSVDRKLKVVGSTYFDGYLNGDQVIEKYLGASSFTDGVANQAIDIRFGNSAMGGLIEIQITSTFSNQNAGGGITKIFALLTNPGNNIYTNESRVTEAIGNIVDNFSIGEFQWDSTNSTYRIPISHIVSTGNPVYVRIRALAPGTGPTIFDNTLLSSAYTLTALSKNYENFNSPVGIGTTSPSSKLEVYSGSGANYIYATNGTAATFNGLMIRYNSTDYMGAIGNPSSGEFRIGGFNVSGYYTTIYSNNSETVRVTAGNVGIGTTTPSAKLQVVGDGIFSSNVAVNTTSPYSTSVYSLDINGGLLVKNTGRAASITLINADPSGGGNNAFVNHTVGGTLTASYANIQTYYGASIAAGILKLQQYGGTVSIWGQLNLANYTTSTSFTGTAVATLAVDASGNVITITGGGGSGTVTSIATSGTVSGITLTGGTITTSGTITLGGTLAVLPSNFASQTANTILAGPTTGVAAAPTFRTLVAADIPSLSGSYLPLSGGTLTGALSGTSASFSGTNGALVNIAGSSAGNNTTYYTATNNTSNTMQLGIASSTYVNSSYPAIVSNGVYLYSPQTLGLIAESGYPIYLQTGGINRLTIASTGAATFSSTIAASNFSGTSSGTNTGDQTNISGYAYNLITQDIRTISPSSSTAGRMAFGFTSFNNNNTANYADYIHLRSYIDSSGGNDNLIVFNKGTIAMRIYQQSFGSSSAYSTYADVLMSNNYSSYALPLTGGTLTGALSGTSATFSSVVTVASPFTIKATNPYIQWQDAAGTRLGYIQHSTNLVMSADTGDINLSTTSGQFWIKSGGNVGIGTTSPTYTLDVNGTGRFSGALNITIPTSGNINYLALNDDSWVVGDRKSISWYQGATKLTSIDAYYESGGNVGLRFSTYSTGYIQDVLSIASTGAATFSSSVTAQNMYSTSDNSEQIVIKTTTDNNKQLIFGRTSTDARIIAVTQNTGYVPLLLNPSGGNVGIGTTTGTYTLDVNGPSRFQGFGVNSTPISTATSANFVRFTNTGGDFYLGQESSTAGGFFTGALAYASVLYSGTSQQFIIGGTSRMLINTSGNVGIGTTSPTQKLDVVGYGKFSSGLLSDSLNAITYPYALTLGTSGADAGSVTITAGSTSGYVSSIYVGAGSATPANTIVLTTASTERVRINSSGNVGIGTTAPAGKLDISGGSYNTGLIVRSSDTGGTGLNLKNTDTGGHDWYLISTGTGNGGGAGNLGFYDNTNGNYLFYIKGVSGNVGIGTTSPTSRLTVNDTGDIPYLTINTTATDNRRTRLQFTKGGNAGLELGTDYGMNDSTDFYFYNRVGSNTYMTIGASSTYIAGSVGIGTTSPAYTLDVNGTGRFSGNVSIYTSGYPALNLGINSSNQYSWVYDNPNENLVLQKNGSTQVTFTNAGRITASSFSDGYITLGAAQINRSGGNVELQYSAAGGVRIFGNTAYPITFASSTGAATFTSAATNGVSIVNTTSASALISFSNTANGHSFGFSSTGTGGQRFSFFNGAPTEIAYITSAGAATFSSSVTANIFYDNVYSAGWMGNNASTYTQWRTIGSKNNYSGFYDTFSGVNSVMYDSSGNGGTYYEGTGTWYTYFLRANGCLGINGSGTSSSYSMQINGGKGIYVVAGNSVFGGTISASNLSGTNTGDQTNISGNAATATTATGANNIYLTSLGNATVNVSNGSSAVYRNENGSGGNLNYAPVLHLGGGDTMWQIQGDYYSSTTLQWRAGYQGTWYAWRQILHSANYNSYSPTLTGTGASGTWGINVTGTSSNITAYTINQSVGTGNSPSFAGLTINTGGTGTWGPFVVNSTSLWGDGATLYATIGAGGAAGIMIYNPHIVWDSAQSFAGVKFGRSGGVSSGAYYVIGTGASDNFFITKNGSVASPQFNINTSGNATFSGTISASNLSGTNTGDQTNISGNAATATTATYVYSPDGGRNPSTTSLPTTNPRIVRFDFAGAGYITGATGNYAGVMTYTPWDGTTASTGDSSYQLAFCNYTGVNASGLPGLAIRKGIDSAWNSTWYQLWHNGNFTPGNYLPLTGGTLTGPLIGTSAAFTGNVTWQGINNGNPRSLAIGYSGGAYGQAGYGVTFTSGGAFNYAINDIVSLWEAYDGLKVYAAGSGSVGTAISFTTVLDARRSTFTWMSNTVLHSANYNSYSPTLTGTGASGTWGISITGNAATVTHNSGRVDGTYYNVGWFSGVSSPAYSCDAVQIQSSTGTLTASQIFVGATSSAFSTTNRGLVSINGVSNAILGLTIGGVAKGYMYHDGTNLAIYTYAGLLSLVNSSGNILNVNGANVGIGTTSPSQKLDVNGNVNVNGTLTATVKSFVIPHPSKPGKTLQYGVLEGPEHSVYVRGKIQNTNIIELPDYWIDLVDQESITVNLTSIGKHQQLYVEGILGNQVMIAGDENINAYYTVYGERKDVAKLVTEY